MFKRITDSLFSPAKTEDRFDAICFNFILFDIFFIPLFPLFSVSISLPIMLYWYVKRRNKVSFVHEKRCFSLILLLMIISTLFSVFEFEGASYNTDFTTSAKRCIQYVTSFCYYFFFTYFFISYRRNINNIVFAGIIYITLYALLYSFNQDTFILLKHLLCPFDPQVNRWLGHELLVYRFNYLWADPNNVAYATTALSLFYFMEEKKSIIKKYIILSCLAYVLLCTMSIGGIAVAAVLIGYLIVFTKAFRSSTSAVLMGSLAIIVICCYIYSNYEFFYELIDMGIGQRHDIYGSDGIAGGGGRGADLLNGLRKFNPIFLFVGSGKEGYVTEIGHIYVWYMYGLPVYVYFLYVLFGKRKRQTWAEYLSIVPMFVGFTMNIAIGEQKYLLLTLLISAYYSAKNYNLRRDYLTYENLHIYNINR